MMFDRAYRQRLEADLARWEADGVITPAVGTAIRVTLPPLASGVNIAVVVAIVGGLLIAAAFLAFVAAHWIELARPLRLAMLFAGVLVAHGFGGWFARAGQAVLADLCAAVGAIIFGAAIALVGQMYHLGGDFAGGMLLWAMGALAAAALTGSRGALAVALAAAIIWSWMRTIETDVPHFAFAAFWLIAGGLALAWNSRVAAHLVAVAALPWWLAASFEPHLHIRPSFMLANGAALLFGGGLALAASTWERPARAGSVLSTYGALALAGVAILEAVMANEVFRSHTGLANQPLWIVSCGVTGVIFAVATAATARRIGTAFAAGAIGLVLAAAAAWTPQQSSEPWLAYAALLCAMLCLVVSGMLDTTRPRIVAGWLGIAGVIAAITWAVKGSLLNRSIFLAAAGIVAVALALVLNRFVPRARE
ncbi:DUF2157 domain-containing protein [Bradyrhizobium sp. CCBAU 051011]|uniref:DUF2157 domain-containing protein n=1 Tax=Bradyrhizobium sp. CCBAU 051011 TaxID=858422 RepID=UPI001FF02AFE|nr:DUF2157 domain-containing protein [Bradyrhizobium sp. CCBAU 051011]